MTRREIDKNIWIDWFSVNWNIFVNWNLIGAMIIF